MPLEHALPLSELPAGSKKAVKVGETEILLVHTEEGTLHAVEAKCPHAGGPLEQGAMCNGRLICPWHTGTFELATGALVEPPPLRSLKHYEVQVEGDAILVDPTPVNAPSLAHYDDNALRQPTDATTEHHHMMTIGGGAAATAAICTLRQNGFAGRITMIDPVTSEPVDRTNLSKMTLAGQKPVEPLWNQEEKNKLRVERLVTRVEHLDGDAGTLRTSDGLIHRFDAALLAPGGIPRRLGIPGEHLPHVHTIRHAQDMDKIAATMGEDPKGKQVVLIGDSFIAFEAASALTIRGLKATVVSRSPEPFSKQFGEAAQAILSLHRANGVTLQAGAEAREITAEAVMLHSGESLPAALVVVAVGVRVATDFQHGLPTEDDGGILVDETLKAAAKLWVAGDAASVNGTRIEHWRVAEQHGRTAAFGMLHRPGEHDTQGRETYGGVPFFWTFHFGKRFGYVGHASQWDDLQVDGSLGDTNFLAYYVKDHVVKAVFSCGRDSETAMLAESMREPLTLEQARKAAASM
jgi:NADPH-dependent 2,4-dienoyl-CoA reductase/sulfur reductase-like enzyme/nitrite reductase/ring-hydroxylating ferredoxin subunit